MNPFSHLKHAALSDVGKKRKNNEDAFGVFPEAGVFCVADGMGGGDDGEIASAAVVRAVEGLAARLKPDESGGVCARDAGDALTRALSAASAWICNRAHERKLNGCGSTFVGVVFDPTDPAQAMAVHAGDSRLYLLRGRSIRQITRDHSVAELMGEKDESKVNPMFRSMVVNGIGIREKADPEFTPFRVAAGDRVLICSDGLSRMVPDKRIASVARAEEDPDKAVAALVAAALDAGGVDNVTAVLVQIGELPGPVSRRELSLDIPSEEMDTVDSATSSGETDKTGETRTCATMLSGVAEEDSFGDESAEPLTSRQKANPSGRRLGLTACVALFVLAAVLAGAFALVYGRRRGKPVVCEPSAPIARPSTPVKSQTPVSVAQPSVSVEPQPSAAVDQPSLPVETPTASLQTTLTVRVDRTVLSTQAVREAVGPSVEHMRSGVVSEFVDACGDESAKSFVRVLTRLLPDEERTPDFTEESDRFLKSARQLARLRGEREAETAAVDLKVLLLNAESARSASLLRQNDAGTKNALTAWDVVLKGNSSDEATQTSCARLMKFIGNLR